MGTDLSYDDMRAFFSSYVDLFAWYDEERLPCHDDSGSSPHTFPPHQRHAPWVIMDLVARSHLPTTDDLEFIGIVEGGGYLIFMPFARARAQAQTLSPQQAVRTDLPTMRK